MPLFEFTCRSCGHRFETLVLGSRRASCPKCSSGDLEKLYSTFAAGSSNPSSSSRPSGAPRFT
jgi:putative FmdB family regulatory protein